MTRVGISRGTPRFEHAYAKGHKTKTITNASDYPIGNAFSIEVEILLQWSAL